MFAILRSLIGLDCVLSLLSNDQSNRLVWRDEYYSDRPHSLAEYSPAERKINIAPATISRKGRVACTGYLE
jgi:hypothetical protein